MAYATLADFKAHARLDSHVEDSLITTLLDRATTFIENYTLRKFTSTTGTKNVPPDYVYHDTLILPDDAVSVSTVVESGNTLTEGTDYYVLTDPRRNNTAYALRRIGAWWSCTYDTPVQITAEWGYSSSPPADIVMATVLIAEWMYRQGAEEATAEYLTPVGIRVVQNIPKAAAVILQRYARNEPF